MYDEVRRVRMQIRRSFHGPAWHGPSVKEALAGVTHREAMRHPLPSAHSIWELVLHQTAWLEVVVERLQGTFVTVEPGDDWAEVESATEQDWQAALTELEKAQCALERALDPVTDKALADFVPGCSYTNYFMLMGIVQHNVYHAGQIMLIKKAVR